jgi:MFS family permease
MTFTVAPSAVVVGILVTHIGRYRWAIWTGFSLSVLGMGVLYLLEIDSSIVQWVFLMLPAGVGMGMLFPSLGFAIQASSTPENMAIAVAMFSFFRAFGQAIGVAIGGTIFQNRMYKNLLAYPSLAPMASHYSRDAAGLVQIVRAMSNDGAEGAQKLMLKQAYTDSLRIVWVVCAALLAVALLLSLLTKEYDLTMGLTSDQTIRDKKKKTSSDEGIA